MVFASIHIIHNTVQNYLPFWILVYRAVPWYIPPVQYQLCIYVCYTPPPIKKLRSSHEEPFSTKVVVRHTQSKHILSLIKS